MQGESGLNTSEDEDDFEIVNDGNENMQPRIDVEGGVDGADVEQESFQKYMGRLGSTEPKDLERTITF